MVKSQFEMTIKKEAITEESQDKYCFKGFFTPKVG